MSPAKTLESVESPPRPRGRPKAEQECMSLTAWVPVTTADRLIKLANQREQSVSALVRQLLILRLR